MDETRTGSVTPGDRVRVLQAEEIHPAWGQVIDRVGHRIAIRLRGHVQWIHVEDVTQLRPGRGEPSWSGALVLGRTDDPGWFAVKQWTEDGLRYRVISGSDIGTTYAPVDLPDTEVKAVVGASGETAAQRARELLAYRRTTLEQQRSLTDTQQGMVDGYRDALSVLNNGML